MTVKMKKVKLLAVCRSKTLDSDVIDKDVTNYKSKAGEQEVKEGTK